MFGFRKSKKNYRIKDFVQGAGFPACMIFSIYLKKKPAISKLFIFNHFQMLLKPPHFSISIEIGSGYVLRKR